MTIVAVWQSMSDDNGGISKIPGRYYFTYEEAKKAGNGWGEKPEPIKKFALMVDGVYYELGNEIAVYKDTEEMKKSYALSKLTPEERKLLGLVE